MAEGYKLVMRKPPRIFISHNYEDADMARALVRCLMSAFALDEHAIRCTSLGGHRIEAGQPLRQQLLSDLASIDVVLVIVTPRTAQSHWVTYEISAAEGRNKPVIPIDFGHTPIHAWPIVLRNRVGLSAERNDDVEALLDRVKHLMGVQVPSVSRLMSAIRAFNSAIHALAAQNGESPSENEPEAVPDTQRTEADEILALWHVSYEILDWYYRSDDLRSILHDYDLPRHRLKSDRIEALLEEFGLGPDMLIAICNKTELKHMCESLDLAISGNKPELAMRVVHHWSDLCGQA